MEPRSAGYTAPVVAEPAPQQEVMPPITTYVDGIPPDIYEYFDIDVPTVSYEEKDDIREITKWAMQFGTVGDALKQISMLEHRLGAPAIHERRYSKMLHWIRLQDNITELRKRQEALHGHIRQ